MHLDVVGFSAMMGRDEEATTDRILALHRAVSDAVGAHGGSVAGTAGDSVLASFDSIVGAVTCAERIQKALASADESAGARIRARVGVHLGDVIVDGDTVFGDGVNIAARLEQAAEPGGILVSEAVYQQVKGRVDLPFEDAGVRRLKNIADPVRLYRVPASALGGDAPERAMRSAPSTGVEVVVPEHLPEAIAAIGDIIRQATELARQQIEDRKGTARAPGAPAHHRGALPGPGEWADTADWLRRAGGPKRARRRVQERSSPAVVAATHLVPLTIGVLLLVGWRTGYSESGWFPLLGSAFIGLWLGRVVAAFRAPAPVSGVILSAAIAVGSFCFDNPPARAIAWVVAASVLGRAIHRATRDTQAGKRRG
jgi:class 3 adenylate cyclase